MGGGHLTGLRLRLPGGLWGGAPVHVLGLRVRLPVFPGVCGAGRPSAPLCAREASVRVFCPLLVGLLVLLLSLAISTAVVDASPLSLCSL